MSVLSVNFSTMMADQVVNSEHDIPEFEDEESFFQDVDILQNHGIVRIFCTRPANSHSNVMFKTYAIRYCKLL